MAGFSVEAAGSARRWITVELVVPLGHFRISELQEAHPQTWAHLLHPDPELTRVFLAEETVRLGGRGREVVGRVFNGAEELPLTGCEGYFVSTSRDHADPPGSGRQVGDRRTPAEIVLMIAHLGAHVLDEVERDLDTRFMTSRDTTADEILRWVEAGESDEELVRCVHGVYGGLLGVLRANNNPELAAFRDLTYRLVAERPNLEVVASDDVVILRYQVRNAAPAEPFTTRVSLDHRLRRGYEVLAAVSPHMGNPVIRSCLQHYS